MTKSEKNLSKDSDLKVEEKELKDEMKETDGSPEVKQKIRILQS